jgi:predicted nucleotidyltransferase
MYSSEDFADMVKIFRTHVHNLNALYLFGSYANNAATEQSDADIAVIVEQKPEWEERHALLNALWNDLGKKKYLVDIVIKQKADFEKDRDVSVTLSHTIAHEGKLLWQTAV